ncbi:MAG: transglycosylase domain-containing protein, partial [Oscillospiraceae bacterium]
GDLFMARKSTNTLGSTIKKVGNLFFKSIFTLVMIGIITGCIVASILTVYVLKYIDDEDVIDISDVKLNYTSIIYANEPKTNEPYELQRIYSDANSIWVDIDQIPEYMVNAAIAGEDKRFNTHNGVDWFRTFQAAVNHFIGYSNVEFGGSTITQQVVKNITDDNAPDIVRKVREIFRAVNVDKNFSKEQIMEVYLNIIPVGNNVEGVQAAANLYFSKDVSELTLAECVSIVCITKNPSKYNPLKNPENNKVRRDWFISQMLEQSFITQQQYDEAINQQLVFTGELKERSNTLQSYFVDYVIESVIADLVAQKGYTPEYARKMIYRGGYRIYTTVNEEIQSYLEEMYLNQSTFPKVLNKEYPQTAFVLLEPNGKVVAMIGGNGKKDANLIYNRATQAHRQIGSTIKPIGPYALALEEDLITWSTKIDDSPITIKEKGEERLWPVNFYGSYLGPITMMEALQRSSNTIPVKLVDMLTPNKVFSFIKSSYHFPQIKAPDEVGLSQLALGGTNQGISPLELAGSYQIFANGGLYTRPYAYTKVVDSDGEIILQADTTAKRVVSSETAMIMNKFLQSITDAPFSGTKLTKLPNVPVGGKTGTSSNNHDQWYVGITPYYIGTVWMGFDKNEPINYPKGSYPPPVLWKNLMKNIHKDLPTKDFPVSTGVVTLSYCTESGDLASDLCPSVATGYYKESKKPNVCTIHTQGSILPDGSFPPIDNGGVDGDNPSFIAPPPPAVPPVSDFFE